MIKIVKGKLLYYILFLFSSNCLSAEGMPQFNAKSFNSQLFWLLLTFASLYLAITYVILPRIRENIRLRKNKIANDLERAENIKIEIENMISQSNIKYEEAKSGVQKTIKNALLRSEKECANQMETIKKQMANKQSETEKRIAEYKKNIEKDIAKSTISLSAAMLYKINYKNSSAEEIEKEVLEFSMSNNV